MDNFFYLASSAVRLQQLLFPFTAPLIMAGLTSILVGVLRERPGLKDNRSRLITASVAQGVQSFLVLLYGSMEYHISPSRGVSDAVASAFINGPLLLQIPLASSWAWWCRRAWPVSLGIGLCWVAYSLGAGFMATMAATGRWL